MHFRPKRVAPSFLAYFVTILTVSVFGLFIALLISLFTKEFNLSLYLFIGIGLVLGSLYFFSSFFSWVTSVSLSTKNGNLVYTSYDVVDLMGNSTTTCTINEITKIKQYGKHYKLWGSFTVKEPLLKSKTVNTYVISYYNDDIIQKIKEFQK